MARTRTLLAALVAASPEGVHGPSPAHADKFTGTSSYDDEE